MFYTSSLRILICCQEDSIELKGYGAEGDERLYEIKKA
jgi:hypothetical protein